MVDVTCYTLIGDSVDLLRWCVDSASERAGAPHEWTIVNWKESAAVAGYCADRGHRVVVLRPAPLPGLGAHPEQRTAAFIKSLYAAFNAGYEHSSTKWVARMGSDQFFSKDWLKNLLACAERHGERAVYHTTPIESPVAKRSRHEIRDWGTTPGEFDERGRDRFDLYADDLAWRYRSDPTVLGSECDLWYNHPTRGRQRRADGGTFLMTRDLWSEFGPMPLVVKNGVAPDVAFIDAILDGGVPNYLCRTSVVYHTVRGESRDIQK